MSASIKRKAQIRDWSILFGIQNQVPYPRKFQEQYTHIYEARHYIMSEMFILFWVLSFQLIEQLNSKINLSKHEKVCTKTDQWRHKYCVKYHIHILFWKFRAHNVNRRITTSCLFCYNGLDVILPDIYVVADVMDSGKKYSCITRNNSKHFPNQALI